MRKRITNFMYAVCEALGRCEYERNNPYIGERSNADIDALDGSAEGPIARRP